MSLNRNLVAVLPARGGSKRIPRKNVRDFCGKPMIAWAIEAAHGSELFERIIVSTDDKEIADIAAQWGAEVPFMRPAKLADDFSGTTEVIAHATEWAVQQIPGLCGVCCVYATAALLQAEDLVRGLAAFRSGPWRYAFSATEYKSSIYRSMRRSPSGGVEMIFPEHFSSRSQDLPSTLHDAAQFYWGAPQAWMAHERIFAATSIPVMIPASRVQDIDTAEDWEVAELLFRARVERGARITDP